MVQPGELKAQIESLYRYGQKEKPYVPFLSLCDLLDHDRVVSELKVTSCEPERLQEIARAIIPAAVRVFAILVLIDRVSLVKELITRDKLQDSLLPMKHVDLERWGNMFAAEFRDKQCIFLGAVFSRNTICRHIDDEIPLPILKNECIGKGAFGTVYEIELDPQNQIMSHDFSQRVSNLFYSFYEFRI